MKNPSQIKNAIPSIRNSYQRSLWRGGFTLTGLALAIFALSPAARATDRGNGNTSDGASALLHLTTGSFNTGLGSTALEALTTASNNTATGAGALIANTSGHENTADGTDALQGNTTGYLNTATGVQALAANTTASFNTADGYQALFHNTTGITNTASGVTALYSNTIGDYNTAQGASALYSNTTGIDNTAIGVAALSANTTGGNNSASGSQALQSNTTGSNNIALGSLAGGNLTTGSNNIDIGNAGVAAESNIIRIGTTGTQTATFIAGIRGVAVAGGQAVAVNANGQLGIRASSARFKEAIKPMNNASEAILALQPVVFRYKKELDAEGVPQFGLVAEQVAKVNPDLVARDDQGKPFTVRYDEVNAMLLNEFLKEHKAFLEEQSTVEELKKQVATLTAGLQKVSAQLEATKPAPQVVNNP